MNVPTIDIVQTGANIKALRKAAGIKVKDVADTLGVSTQAVAKWQAGTALPTIDNLVILAAMLDTKIDDRPVDVVPGFGSDNHHTVCTTTTIHGSSCSIL